MIVGDCVNIEVVGSESESLKGTIACGGGSEGKGASLRAAGEVLPCHNFCGTVPAGIESSRRGTILGIGE